MNPITVPAKYASGLATNTAYLEGYRNGITGSFEINARGYDSYAERDAYRAGWNTAAAEKKETTGHAG